MAICWERAIPLAFHLCVFFFFFFFFFSALLVVRVPYSFGVWGRVWNPIVSIPDHCLFMSFTYCFFKTLDLSERISPHP